MKNLILLLVAVVILASCGKGGSKKSAAMKSLETMENNYQVRLITVDPGHFHAALVQKTMYPQVSPEVHVYAPAGPDLNLHLNRINSYNTRKTDPTSWNEVVYTGDDFFEKMLSDKSGNVVVLSGNNRKKAEYISRSVNSGLNVLADKPMIISPADFPALREAFRTSVEKGVLLYDIMTERFEITTIMQKLLSQEKDIFGDLVSGTAENPAVTKISVHHFAKIVSGTPLQRPAWFFDVDQQGEGIVDVTTHLVDLIQWECFPEQILDTTDVYVVAARRWPTMISKDQFKEVTGIDTFPEFLKKDLKDGVLQVYSNGEILYQLKGVWAKVSVTWNFIAPPGGGDTHFSVMRGSKCDLVIRQGAAEKYVPTLFIENIKGMTLKEFNSGLRKVLDVLPYDSLGIQTLNNSLKILIPDKYRISHEEHFGQVTARFLEYLKAGRLPEWEIPGMITKYYTTTKALQLAKK